MPPLAIHAALPLLVCARMGCHRLSKDTGCAGHCCPLVPSKVAGVCRHSRARRGHYAGTAPTHHTAIMRPSCNHCATIVTQPWGAMRLARRHGASTQTFSQPTRWARLALPSASLRFGQLGSARGTTARTRLSFGARGATGTCAVSGATVALAARRSGTGGGLGRGKGTFAGLCELFSPSMFRRRLWTGCPTWCQPTRRQRATGSSRCNA